MKVLVADDSRTVRGYLEQLLIDQGYEVYCADNGETAWELLQKEDLRLAILDWVMPGIDGVDICKRLATHHRQRLVYAILLTSKTGDDNIVAALQAGASDYLVKPFQPTELFARLRVGVRTIELQMQLSQREKLEAMGRLAAGIAHEINTPIQFIGDNTRFLRNCFTDLQRLLDTFDQLAEKARIGNVGLETLVELEGLAKEIDRDFLLREIPLAVSQTLEGVERVAKIVRAMKELAHPGDEDQHTALQLNKAIENTITVTRSEWKEVADVVTDFDPELPPVLCMPGPLGQVLLNLIVNAAQAIEDSKRMAGKPRKGTITVSTRRHGDEWTEIRVADTGTGIPESVRAKIFDPFFTTKPVGKGTGQGLALAHSIVVKKHGGSIGFETELGKGTTFVVRLPNQPPQTSNEQVGGAA